MAVLEKLNKYLFLLGLFFIPFNSFEGVNYLGEFRNESAAYFFFSGFILCILKVLLTFKISIPYKNFIFQIIIFFLFWCLLGTVLNIPSVLENYFKKTSGSNRFIRQYGSIIISSFFFLLFYWAVLSKMTIESILKSIRKVFTISLIFVSIYGFLEILLVVFKISQVRPVLNLFSYFPFLEVKVVSERISAVSYEPPFLAIYLISIAGWMFSYIITSKGLLKYLPTALILVLTFYSGSRTALAVVSFQFICFLFFLFSNLKNIKYAIAILLGIFLTSFSLIIIYPNRVLDSVEEKINSLDFKQNLTESVSNKSRLGIQYASLQVAKRNPILGVGFGQQAYHNRFFYPNWATKDNYEFELMYKNEKLESFPPGYNLYIRIYTELGLVGALIFLLLIVSIFYSLFKIYNSTEGIYKDLSIILIISFIGLCINFLQIDTFRIYAFWINIVILMCIINNLKERSKSVKFIKK
ncbi:O-antigen ligase family protein [Mesonia mobilis]|uniref:O-antigen ligase-related domain-containing protein n=1 Tax=Mesonia mobilis TaxID=369791 RepID=A0ABQ3BXD4_9FLAO|nr:O-antigen ligase family protein [Mesonia mobilis]MBQ0737126.1 O-antigen ligase family protein [Aquimarina celericrescens]GGZ60372.1 hypothetical protein GCM10008088_22340 [Mesonia mobilis]